MKDMLIASLTVGEFIGALKDAGLIIVQKDSITDTEDEAAVVLDFSDPTRYGCGLKAIESRYNVSHLTAYRMKAGILAPAIYQAGARGKIWIDYEKADALMRKRKTENNNETITAAGIARLFHVTPETVKNWKDKFLSPALIRESRGGHSAIYDRQKVLSLIKVHSSVRTNNQEQ